MWLSFWTVYGLFSTTELFIGFILSFIPFYSIIRLVFFMFLMMPQTQGAKIVYTSVFKPLLIKYKPEIQAFIEKVSEKASEIQKDGMAVAAQKAKELSSAENAAKAATMMNTMQNNLDEMEKNKEEEAQQEE